MPAPDDDLHLLLSALNRDVPRRSKWPGGWPGEVDAALIDAVLSIRARYGGEHSGVRGAVKRWRTYRTAPDDLRLLAAAPVGDLTATLNKQSTGGQLKSEAIRRAATNLVELGVHHAADLDPDDPAQERAYTSVRGLGPVTWAYFAMLLGKPGVKADRWIVRYVRRALDPTATREVSPQEAETLLTEAAARLGRNPTELDHAVWQFARKQGELF